MGAPKSGLKIVYSVLKRNNFRVEYKRRPILDVEAVEYYEKKRSCLERLIKTRSGVSVEVNPHLTLLAKPLKMVFPEAKLVLMMRNPRECVKEYLKGGIFNKERYIFEGISNEYLLEKSCLFWNSIYDFVLEEVPEIEILRYEKMREGLGDIVGFDVGEVVKEKVEELDEEEERVFENICGGMMKRFGYV